MYICIAAGTFTGIRYARFGSTGGSAYMGLPSDSRHIMVTSAFNNLGAGAPTGTDPVMIVSGLGTGQRGLNWFPVQRVTNSSGLGQAFFLLPGFSQQALINPDPWAFHVAPNGRVYIADSRSAGSIAVYAFNAALNYWNQIEVLPSGATDPILSMTGREEGGVTVLYALGQSLSTFNQVLYRINTGSKASVRILTNAANTQIRAVMLPPTDDSMNPVAPSASPSAPPTQTPTPSSPVTGTPVSTGTRSSTGSFSATATATASISIGADPSITASSSVPPSASGSASATPTPSNSAWVARFQPGNLLVLRGGNVTAGFNAGTSLRLLPLFIDVIDVSSSAPQRVVDTVTVPAEADGSGNNGCTIAQQGSNYQQEGFLQRSFDGRSVVWGCHSMAPGLQQPNNVVSPRVIAQLRADGSVDTRTSFADAYTGGNGFSFFRSVATLDGSAFWTAGFAPGVTTGNGIRYVVNANGPTVSRPVAQQASVQSMIRAITIAPDVTGSPQLYTGIRDPTPVRGVSSVGAGLPTTDGAAISLLPGWETWQYTQLAPLVLGMVWENAKSLWTTGEYATLSSLAPSS